MVSNLNSAAVRTSYANGSAEAKTVKQKEATSVSQQGDTSKVDQIKEALASGEYKINLEALSAKIAEELM
ncbi:flagellar biosynthesis anti-sigma factor FlgM [Sulfurimonas sp.]|nr:flagellar biosynthesis anti-sigma factor FlgM [Sulfurimonas sp.]